MCGMRQRHAASDNLYFIIWCIFQHSIRRCGARIYIFPYKIARSCGISIISLCFALWHQLIFALGNMVCTSKIREYPSRDPAFPLESRHSLESPVRKPSGYGINRYMERFLLRMPLTHSGPAPLPSIWNGSLYLKPFRFFTHDGCCIRITRVWNASFRRTKGGHD